MTDKQQTAVVFGLANKRSIAWAIAQKLHAAGWQLAITYQNERLEQEAKDLIADLPGASGFMCDVSFDDQIAKLFEELKSRFGVLHGIVHSVAFAPAGADNPWGLENLGANIRPARLPAPHRFRGQSDSRRRVAGLPFGRAPPCLGPGEKQTNRK